MERFLIIHMHIDNIIVEKINILLACQTHLSKSRVRYVASDTHDCVGSYAVFSHNCFSLCGSCPLSASITGRSGEERSQTERHRCSLWSVVFFDGRSEHNSQL